MLRVIMIYLMALLITTPDTEHERNYNRDPYESYYNDPRGMFRSFLKAEPGEREKEIVAGVEVDGSSKGYPVDTLRKRKKITDKTGRYTVILTYDDSTDRISIRTAAGAEIDYVVVNWFIWKGIHPGTGRYTGS